MEFKMSKMDTMTPELQKNEYDIAKLENGTQLPRNRQNECGSAQCENQTQQPNR
jgi:hypothetical protein